MDGVLASDGARCASGILTRRATNRSSARAVTGRTSRCLERHHPFGSMGILDGILMIYEVNVGQYPLILDQKPKMMFLGIQHPSDLGSSNCKEFCNRTVSNGTIVEIMGHVLSTPPVFFLRSTGHFLALSFLRHIKQSVQTIHELVNVKNIYGNPQYSM